MISNEHGFNFIEIPFNGSNLFVDCFRENNIDLKEDDVLLDKSIEYHNAVIVQSPYQRAVSIYKNGLSLRKEHNLKFQKFSTYFENNLNNWGELVESDKFTSQFEYIKNYEDVDIFKYEELLDSWHSINEYLMDIGLNTIKYYTDPNAIKDWEDYYLEKESIEIVNYIFEDDFENLGYSKL